MQCVPGRGAVVTLSPEADLPEAVRVLSEHKIICSYLSSRYFEPQDLTLLLYAAISSPMAQPRNLVFGHMLSGLIGVRSYQLWGETPWLAAGLGVSGAIAAMLVTRTMHPPGGATALLAVIGGPKVHALGYLYVVVPAGVGACVLLVVALVVNHLAHHRRYPEYWW